MFFLELWAVSEVFLVPRISSLKWRPQQHISNFYFVCLSDVIAPENLLALWELTVYYKEWYWLCFPPPTPTKEALLLSSYHFSNVLLLLFFSVIEVASGEYGDNVIPGLVKAWKAREESVTQKRSLTSSTSRSYDSRNMVVSMLPNCQVKTSTDSIIHAASQTTQVSNSINYNI